MVSMAILIHILERITGCSPQVTVACDNDQALIRSFLPKSQLKARHQSSDLLSVIIDLWQNTSVRVTPSFVKGHADLLKEDLSVLEKLNIKADTHAKEFLYTRPKEAINRKADQKYGMAQVDIKQINISGNISTNIQLSHQIQRSYLAGVRLKRFTDSTWLKIDHIALSRAMKSFPFYKKLFVTKWIAHQLPIGKRMKERQHIFSDKCPICLLEKEDTQHLSSCQHASAINNYFQQLQGLITWAKKVKTDPILLSSMVAVLTQKRIEGTDLYRFYPCVLTRSQHHSVFKEQQLIGWEGFIEGLLSNEWAIQQQRYYTTHKINRSGKAWASGLINQLWTLNYQVWISRNNALHKNQHSWNELHGMEELDKAIQKEWNTGIGTLNRKFSYLFMKYSIESLLSLPPQQKRLWFKVVRSARELSGVESTDAFSSPGALRKWVGL
jgi:hypothetical protein